METKKSPGLMAKVRRKRWTKDDTELTLLSLPTLLWYLIFSYLPMFGVVIAFKEYNWHREDMHFCIICLPVTGQDLRT